MKFVFLVATFLVSTFSNFAQLTTSNLPIVKILFNGPISAIPDEPKAFAIMGIIDNESGVNHVNDVCGSFDGYIGIETRGNTTQGFDKKSYSIELITTLGQSEPESLLGMPEESDWILHAMVIDKTLLRIPMSFYLSNKMGHYAARWRFVELVINDEYRGVYILTEKIKRDPNRVNTEKLLESDIGTTEVTGGYILRIDWLEGPGFESDFNAKGGDPMYFQWYYPKSDSIQPEQVEYISNYMKEFEEALFSPDGYNDLSKHYSQYIDVSSFADFLIMNELSKNSDGYKLSSYVHKYNIGAGNKFHAGPIWDFDQTYGSSNVCSGNDHHGWLYTQSQTACGDLETMPLWWERLMQDSLFQNHLKCRWEKFRASFLHKDSINAWIDDQVDLIQDASARNFTKWPHLGMQIWYQPEPIPADYQGEIFYMKEWISNRIDWLDANMPGDCSQDMVDLKEYKLNDLQCYPNPSTNIFNISVREYNAEIHWKLFSQDGKLIRDEVSTDPNFKINLSDEINGIYILDIQAGDFSYKQSLVKY